MTDIIAVENPLTEQEARELTNRARDSIRSAAYCLREIHRRRGPAGQRGWTLLGHRTWLEYVSAEFGYSKQHAHRLIDFADILDVVTDGSPIGDPPAGKLTEYTVRPFTKLLPEATPDADGCSLRDDPEVMSEARARIAGAWRGLVERVREAEPDAEPRLPTAAEAAAYLMDTNLITDTRNARGSHPVPATFGDRVISAMAGFGSARQALIELFEGNDGRALSARVQETCANHARIARAPVELLEAIGNGEFERIDAEAFIHKLNEPWRK